MSFPVSILVNADRELGPLRPIYRYFGADEPNYAYMKDGEKLLRKLGEMGPEQVFFRVHSLLVTGDGTPALKWCSTNAYTEDENGNPIYNWKIIDHIFDTYLERNIKPYVKIGFMPEAMSTNPQPYQHSWTAHAKYHEIFTAGPTHPKTSRNGRSLFTNGPSTVQRNMALRKFSPGTGRSGTNRILATGEARPRNLRPP